MTPARYAVSVDNNLALKKYEEGSRVKVVSMAAPASFDPNCRLMGPIQGSDGMTVPQFVQKAFNDELKFANLYAEDGVTLGRQPYKDRVLLDFGAYERLVGPGPNAQVEQWQIDGRRKPL